MDLTFIILLLILGVVLLTADIFLPSHGVFSVLAFGAMMYGTYQAFKLSNTVGVISLGSLVVLVPMLLLAAVKTWHRTPLGRRISPPNPMLSEQDRLPVDQLREVIGTAGRSVTLLRPVGICVFNGQRLESVAESGIIAANVPVEAVRLVDRTVVVRALAPTEEPPAQGLPQ